MAVDAHPTEATPNSPKKSGGEPVIRAGESHIHIHVHSQSSPRHVSTVRAAAPGDSIIYPGSSSLMPRLNIPTSSSLPLPSHQLNNGTTAANHAPVPAHARGPVFPQTPVAPHTPSRFPLAISASALRIGDYSRVSAAAYMPESPPIQRPYQYRPASSITSVGAPPTHGTNRLGTNRVPGGGMGEKTLNVRINTLAQNQGLGLPHVSAHESSYPTGGSSITIQHLSNHHQPQQQELSHVHPVTRRNLIVLGGSSQPVQQRQPQYHQSAPQVVKRSPKQLRDIPGHEKGVSRPRSTSPIIGVSRV